jgi:hypothetical protein
MTHTILKVKRRKSDPLAADKSAGLIMSATLVPPTAAVARANPADRLSDYLDALRYYLSLPNTVIDRILFVDNSNSDITPLAKLAQTLQHEKNVELISFEGNDHPYQRGKAYGEFKLMDYGLSNTTLFDPEDIVWKTTGRLKFLNLPEMARRCCKLSFDVLCDLHNVPWVGSGNWSNYHNMDLRVFAFRMRAYDEILRDLWRTREEGLDAEFMYHRMRQPHQNVRIISRFPLQPQLQGISGRHERDYRSTSQRAKDAVRSTARKITPWLWL